MVNKVTLIGLPGCGISSLEPTLLAELKNLTSQDFPKDQVWTVINMAERLPDNNNDNNWSSKYLLQCLTYSNAIVFTFVEQACLEKQTNWQAWIKQSIKILELNNLPRLRWLNGKFSKNWYQGYLERKVASKQTLKINNLPALPVLDSFYFPISRLNLEHLFFSLDALKHHQEFNVVRVSGKVEATENLPPVAIEVTAAEMKTYPLRPKESLNHQLKIQGENLKYIILQEVVNACLLR